MICQHIGLQKFRLGRWWRLRRLCFDWKWCLRFYTRCQGKVKWVLNLSMKVFVRIRNWPQVGAATGVPIRYYHYGQCCWRAMCWREIVPAASKGNIAFNDIVICTSSVLQPHNKRAKLPTSIMNFGLGPTWVPRCARLLWKPGALSRRCWGIEPVAGRGCRSLLIMVMGLGFIRPDISWYDLRFFARARHGERHFMSIKLGSMGLSLHLSQGKKTRSHHSEEWDTCLFVCQGHLHPMCFSHEYP